MAKPTVLIDNEKVKVTEWYFGLYNKYHFLDYKIKIK